MSSSKSNGLKHNPGKLRSILLKPVLALLLLLLLGACQLAAPQDLSVEFASVLPDWFREVAAGTNPPLSWSNRALVKNMQDYVPDQPAVPRTRASIFADYKTRIDDRFPPSRVPPNPNGTLMLNVSGSFRGMRFSGSAVSDGFWVTPGDADHLEKGKGRGVSAVMCGSALPPEETKVRVRNVECNVLFAEAALLTGKASPLATIAGPSNGTGCGNSTDCARMASAIQELSCGRDCAADDDFGQEITRTPFFKLPVSRDALYRTPALTVDYPEIDLSLYSEWVFDPLRLQDRQIKASLQSVRMVPTAPLCDDPLANSILPPVDNLLFEGSRMTCVDWNGIVTSVYVDEIAVRGGANRTSCAPKDSSTRTGQVLFPAKFALNDFTPLMYLVVSSVENGTTGTDTGGGGRRPSCVISFYQSTDPAQNNVKEAQLNSLYLTNLAGNSPVFRTALETCSGAVSFVPNPAYNLSYVLSFAPATSAAFPACEDEDTGRCYLYLSHDLSGVMNRWTNFSVPVTKIIPDTDSRAFCAAFNNASNPFAASAQPQDPSNPKSAAAEVAKALLEDMINAGIRVATGADNADEILATSNTIQAGIDMFGWMQIATAASSTIAGIAGFMYFSHMSVRDKLKSTPTVLVAGLYFVLACIEAGIVKISCTVTLATMALGKQQQVTLGWITNHQNLAAHDKTFDYYVSGTVTLTATVPGYGGKVAVLSLVIILALGVSLYRWLQPLVKGVSVNQAGNTQSAVVSLP